MNSVTCRISCKYEGLFSGHKTGAGKTGHGGAVWSTADDNAPGSWDHEGADNPILMLHIFLISLRNKIKTRVHSTEIFWAPSGAQGVAISIFQSVRLGHKLSSCLALNLCLSCLNTQIFS